MWYLGGCAPARELYTGIPHLHMTLVVVVDAVLVVVVMYAHTHALLCVCVCVCVCVCSKFEDRSMFNDAVRLIVA